MYKKYNDKIILVSGMIGLGKTSVSELLGERFGLEVLYESVEDNPILPFLYTATEEDAKKERYPYLLQMWFLNTRFTAMKKALVEGGKILDRCIFEDMYFAEKFLKQGKLNQNEFMIYRKYLKLFTNELNEIQTKPDLMVYLKGSFETVMSRIDQRGRGYEIDPELIDYYRDIWSDYDHWIQKNYKESEILILDMDEIDVVGDDAAADLVCKLVKDRLEKVGN